MGFQSCITLQGMLVLGFLWATQRVGYLKGQPFLDFSARLFSREVSGANYQKDPTPKDAKGKIVLKEDLSDPYCLALISRTSTVCSF